jgi:hypothetical protein
MARLHSAAGESVLALQIRLTSWLWLVRRKWRGCAADSAVRLSRDNRNGGLLTLRELVPQQRFDSPEKAAAWSR